MNKEDYKRAAGCIVRCGDRYLVLLRSAQSFQPGTWGFPGGKIDSGETPKEAAIRETFEETGFLAPTEDVTQVNEVWHVFTEDDKVNYFTFIVSVDKQFDVVLQEGESDDFAWMTVAELEADTRTMDTVVDFIKESQAQ